MSNPAHIDKIIETLTLRLSSTGAPYTVQNIKAALDEDSFNTLMQSGKVDELVANNGEAPAPGSPRDIMNNLSRFGLNF